MHFTIPNTPEAVTRTLIRISFGLSLMFVGIAHITDLQSFSLVVGDGFDGVFFLSYPAWLYAYLHPFLLLFGGALLVVNRFPVLAAWCAGIPLVMVPAGMLSKAIFALDLNDLMPSAINTWIWILVYVYVIRETMGNEKVTKA